MASRFVSGGTIAGDGESAPQQSVPEPSSSKTQETREEQQWDNNAIKRNAEWEAVQRDLEAERRRREEARRAQVEGGPGGENKSLYDILQANKAAKQAAFEEKTRISNQFRALDDDEIDFLESMRDERRVEEEKVKRETEERLASFRQAQKATGTTAPVEGVDDGDVVRQDNGDSVEEWSGVGKKRKRVDKEAKSIVKGVKRRASSSEKDVRGTEGAMVSDAKPQEPMVKPSPNDMISSNPISSSMANQVEPVEETTQEKPKLEPKLGLVDYGSDEDDDD